MGWLQIFIVFQCTILLLHGRPDGTSTTLASSLSSSSSAPASLVPLSNVNEKVSLEMKHSASVAAIVASLESKNASAVIPATRKHSATNTPVETIKRVMTPVTPSKNTEKSKEVTSGSTAASTSKTTRINVDTLPTKQKPLLTTTTTAKTTVSTPKVTLPAAVAEKPTIFDIISETEKNHTLMRQMNRISSTASTPIALPLSASSPSIIRMNQQPASDAPKAINHMGAIHHNGHPGVAEPLTWQQVESDLIADQSHKETSTAKDGISTWILLSGSDNKPQTPATPVTTASIVGHVDKINVKDVLNERHNYRFQQIHPEKVNKPIKTRDQPEKRAKPNKKDKVIIESTTTLKTTPIPSSTLSGILVASDFATDSKYRRKVTPLPVFNKLNKKKTTTTTTTTEASEELSEILEEEHPISDKIDMSDEYPVDATTPTPFIVLEPKDANFEIPEDRAPTPKKPNKVVKKGVKLSKKKTGVAKNPIKNPKPLTSTIYSYLSREVMPTVGVGLMGLVLTAGIAGYFFGPLGALRRSYDEATDRQDNADNIYSVNNEEYASEGNDHGQNEEEVFSKFLAGMPANYVSRYVKYYRPDGNGNSNPHPNQYNHRRVSQPQFQQQPLPQAQAQASNMVPKYTPYMRYRTPSPHYNPAQYNPQQQYAAYHRNHHINPVSAASAASAASAYQQQQTVSPVYNPQYQDMQKQKSFATNMENVLKHQTATIYGKKNEYMIVNPSVVQEKSVGSEIQAEPEQSTQQLSAAANEDQNTEVIEGEITDDDDNAASQRIQRRTYVVGSSITDNQPAEAIVSASMTASVDGMGGAQKESNEAVFTVTATSHGPRRRRRRDTKSATDLAQTTEKEMKTTTTTLKTKTTKESQPSTTIKITTTTIEPYTTRLYSTTEYANLESDYIMLHEKLMSFDRDYSSADNEKKVEKKIQIEFKSIESDFDSLKKAIDGAKAIEQFQKQIRIRPKNFELSVILKTGITGIRQRIRYMNDLIEHPEDHQMIEKINRRDGSETLIESTTTNSTNTSTSSELPEVENGFVGFLKLLQLKAQFGLNLLKNIRPSFERAFEDVFKRPYVNRM